MLDFTKKRASYLIVGPDGFCPPRSPGGRGMKNMSAAAANFEKRGVVSYRFRKIEESIVGLQIMQSLPVCWRFVSWSCALWLPLV